jgi:diacylglycerol kinase (ATP)
MLVFINPKSCGGSALKKWQAVKPRLSQNINCADIFFLNGSIPMRSYIKAALCNGETEFISAGGDGTLNLLINSIIQYSSVEQLNNIKVGAIGIGSSNDFYKPVKKCEKINNIPVRIDFDKAEPRDVGKITFENDGIIISKYFLINSSIGITADANYFFNNPDRILASLKRKNTQSAILYAAGKNLFKYRNFDADIFSAETGIMKVKITNLGIIKNPNFSGNLSYGYNADYKNGLFNIHLCYEMNLQDRIELFWSLNNSSLKKVRKINSWSTKNISVKSDDKFSVEFDGEVITTKSVQFSVLPKLLRVCKC